MIGDPFCRIRRRARDDSSSAPSARRIWTFFEVKYLGTCVMVLNHARGSSSDFTTLKRLGKLKLRSYGDRRCSVKSR
jgi:hypothetical protein